MLLFFISLALFKSKVLGFASITHSIRFDGFIFLLIPLRSVSRFFGDRAVGVPPPK